MMAAMLHSNGAAEDSEWWTQERGCKKSAVQQNTAEKVSSDTHYWCWKLLIACL